jgi:hypothetical protein
MSAVGKINKAIRDSKNRCGIGRVGHQVEVGVIFGALSFTLAIAAMQAEERTNQVSTVRKSKEREHLLDFIILKDCTLMELNFRADL